MFTYPDINPVAIDLGPLKIHWYGITYLVAFLAGWGLAKYRASRPGSGWEPEEIGDIVFYIVLGVIVGGKLGSVFFYQFDQFVQHPIATLNPMNGGMSFHGGFVGVLLALYLYGRKTGRTFFQVSDFIAPAFPIGLGAGRVGNFINGELWGRPTDLPWGMVYPHVGPEPRHPNQIYQFLGEGVLLFLLVWWFSGKPRPRAAVSGVFCVGYGVYRFLVEFVREPDAQLGFIALDWLTMGQLLSVPMVIAGSLMLYFAYSRGIMDQPVEAVAGQGVSAASKSGATPGVKAEAASDAKSSAAGKVEAGEANGSKAGMHAGSKASTTAGTKSGNKSGNKARR